MNRTKLAFSQGRANTVQIHADGYAHGRTPHDLKIDLIGARGLKRSYLLGRLRGFGDIRRKQKENACNPAAK